MNKEIVQDIKSTLRHQTFLDVLEHQAKANKDLKVFNYLQHGQHAQSITCSELYRDTKCIARTIGQHAKQGDRVLLIYPPGIDYICGFFACLVGAYIAVPVYPPNSAQIERTIDKVLNIISQSCPTVVLTNRAQYEELAPAFDKYPQLAQLKLVITDEITLGAIDWQQPEILHDSIAYLQYTSGSTGAPKGVKISHGNLIHNSRVIEANYEHTGQSRGVIWLPPYHDMGLIGGILQPLYVGFPVYLMSHIEFLKHPIRWLQAVSDFKATSSGGPNFAYRLLNLRRVSEETIASLDLSFWDVAFTGSEGVCADDLRTFADKYSAAGFNISAFYPCYGLAESTLIATGGKKDALPSIKKSPNGSELVGCGKTQMDMELVIVDPTTSKRCDDKVVGEIWLAGPSIAQGYWQDPVMTKQTFDAKIDNEPNCSYLRTGDLGFVDCDELFITGRLKDVLIVRGKNHYPADLEETVGKIASVLFRPNGCAIFSIEVNDTSHIVVVQEIRTKFTRKENMSPQFDDVIEQIKVSINRFHQLAVSQVILVPTGSISKTENGKLQRSQCKDSLLAGELTVIRQWKSNKTR